MSESTKAIADLRTLLAAWPVNHPLDSMGAYAQVLLAFEAGRIADQLENISAILCTALANGSPLVEALRKLPRQETAP